MRSIILNEPNQYLLDSNFLIAFIDETDFHHCRAMEIFFDLKQGKNETFLSDVLINETLSVLAKRCEAKKKKDRFPMLAERFQKVIQGMHVIRLYEFVFSYYGPLLQGMKRFQGKFSFHDCLMLLFLKEVPQVSLITFDQDFKTIEGLKVIS